MKARTLVLMGIVVLVALARLVPHPPNFTPVGALALFGGARFRSPWAAFLVPLSAMLLSDAALELVTSQGWGSGWLAQGAGFYRGMWVVYGAMALVAAVGLLLRRRTSILAVAAGVLAGSLSFFLVTNFAWWAGYDLYSHTAEGLLQSYEAALPFYRWTLLGDACYATALFGGLALAERRYPALRPVACFHAQGAGAATNH
jgi:hypothetical protein